MIAYDLLGIYIFLPLYVLVMSSEIAFAVYQKKYALAETIAAHMIFDASCIAGLEFFGVNIPALIGDFLDGCGLALVRQLFEQTHRGIHTSLHYFGIGNEDA